MANRAATDLAAMTIRSADLTGAPKGMHLGSVRAALNEKIRDARRLAKLFKSYCSDASTISELDAIITDLN